MRLVENCKIVNPDGPGAGTTDLNTATNSVNMANYNRCQIVLTLTQSGAGTGTVTLKQGTTTTASTALAFTEYWSNEAGSPSDALTRVEASTLTTAGAGTGVNIYVFEVKAEDLTKTSANKYIRLNLASLGNNTASNLEYRLYEPRHPAKAGNMISGAS